jgi:hypothetical protein
MEPPANNADYREQDYWDTRYQTEEKYDWFSAYSSFRHHLVNDVKPDQKILMLGKDFLYMKTNFKDDFEHLNFH